MLSFVDLIIVAIFFLVVLAIGFWERKKITLDDYWVNSRKTNKFILIATVLSTFLGAASIIANASIAFSGGGLGTLVLVASFFFYFLIFAKFFAPKIKEFGDRYGAYSVPDFLKYRFSARTRLAGALTILITWLLFLALQILAMGSLFSSIGGINPYLATIIGGAIIIIYTSIGGLRADIRTDIFQFIVMFTLLVIFLPMIFIKAGGVGAIANLPVTFLTGAEFAPAYVFVLALLFLGAGVITSAEIWQRAYAADSQKNVAWAFKVSSIFVALFLVMAVLIGIFGRILLPEAAPNMIIPELLKITLPAGVFGLVIAGFLAAIMSTADTVLLISSMTIVHDFYQQMLKKNLTAEKMLNISRLTTLILGVVSIAISLIIFSITHLAIEAVSFYVVLLPAIIFGFYWKKATEKAAFWSIIAGLIAIIIFLFIEPIQAFIPGLIVSFIVFFAVNYFSKNRIAEAIVDDVVESKP